MPNPGITPTGMHDSEADTVWGPTSAQRTPSGSAVCLLLPVDDSHPSLLLIPTDASLDAASDHVSCLHTPTVFSQQCNSVPDLCAHDTFAMFWVQVHPQDHMAVATVWTHLDKLLYGQHGDTATFVRCAWVWGLSFLS